MSKKRGFKFRGLKFLGFVAVIYLIVALFSTDKFIKSLSFTAEALGEVIPILAVVVFIMAAINLFFNPKGLAKHLGEDGGVKGWLLALGLGILSHGPMYAWYPVLEELKKHGLRNGYIAAFFYTRAIKIPLIPMMIHYFGWAFTVFLSLYIIPAAWLQGWLIDKIECYRSKR